MSRKLPPPRMIPSRPPNVFVPFIFRKPNFEYVPTVQCGTVFGSGQGNHCTFLRSRTIAFALFADHWNILQDTGGAGLW